MTISNAAKNRRSSDRYMLVRVKPARHISDTLASAGDGLYTVTLPHPVAGVERNGTALTKDTSTPSVDDHYLYNEATQTLTVKLASAPDADSNVVVAYYYMFWTTGEARAAPETPDDTSTTSRDWEPRIQDPPSFSQSVKNILAGVFSIDNGTLTVIDSDGVVKATLSAEDSYYNKEIRVWLCVDGLDDMQAAYVGRISKATGTRDYVRFEHYDEFSKLNQPCLMGDTRDYAYWNTNTWSAVDPTKAGSPIPFFIGPDSRVEWSQFSGSLAGVTEYFPVVSSLYEATNLNVQTVSTSTNRSWGLARTQSGVATQDFGTVSRCTEFLAAGIYGLFCTGHSGINVGDTVRASRSGTTYYFQVYSTTDFTFGGNSYNVLLWPVSSPLSSMTSGELLTGPSMYVCAGSRDLYYGMDYTITEVTTDGGNKLTTLQMVTNWESGKTPTTAFDPTSDRVKFRLAAAGSHNQADVLKTLLTKAGMICNDASFTSAGTALNVNCQFSIPYYDEGDFAPYRDYAEAICKSTAGYVGLNASLEAQYVLLSAPSSGTEVDDNLELQAHAVDIAYQDIATQVICYNPHNQTTKAAADSNGPAISRTSNKARYLHGLINVDRFRHVLEKIGDRIDTIMALRSNRVAVYRYSVATEHLTSIIGDDATLSTTGLLGSDISRNVKLFTVSKGVDKVELEATDLEGL